MANIIEITDPNMPELALYRRSETELLRAYEPEPGLFVAESPNVIRRALDGGYEAISYLLEYHQADTAAAELIDTAGEIPVYVSDLGVVTSAAGFNLTRGAVCLMRRKPLPSMEEICRDAKRIVVLDSVENPTNVGAIFRSAAALGFDAVLLTPACSDPFYRRAARVSMGTVFQIPWAWTCRKTNRWPHPAMEELKALGFKTAAMALKADTVNIDDPCLMQEEKLAIIMGNESEGLSDETIAACDYTIKIPMFHGVDSLNVAAAAAVAFWQLRDRG